MREQVVDDRIRLPNSLPKQRLRQFPIRAFRLEKPSRGIHWTIDRDSVRLSGQEILHTVAWGGVHCSGALFKRYMIPQDSKRRAVQKRMFKKGFLHPLSAKLGKNLGRFPSELPGVCFEKILGNDVNIPMRFHC